MRISLGNLLFSVMLLAFFMRCGDNMMNFKTAGLFCVLMSSLPLLGCAEQKPLSNQEKWQKFCKAYEVASYYMMSDRQHNVEREKAITHVEKLPEGPQRDMMIAAVKAAYQVPKYDQLEDKERAMDEFKQGKYQSCLNQPH